MTEMTVRHPVRFALNDEAVTAHVASHEVLVELLRNHVDAVQLAAKTRAKEKTR
jgi:aerobic-type carbon monoxide dehydrogenase small subunit (CoxS/CutS family)